MVLIPKKDWNELFANCLKNKKVLYDVEITKINLKKIILQQKIMKKLNMIF